MDNSNAEPCGNWDGDFTWDGLFMRKHVKTEIQEYDQKDPRTWPLIRNVSSTDNGKDYRKGSKAPEFLAYDQSPMTDFVLKKPLKGDQQGSFALPRKKKINRLFHNYPFNFDRDGELRKHLVISPGELEEWMEAIKTTLKAVKEEAKTSPTPPKEVLSEDSCLDACPDTAYEEIMKTLVDSRSVSVAAVLEEELSCARQEVREWKEKAEKGEKQMAQNVQSFKSCAQKYRAKAANELEKEKESLKQALSKQMTRIKQLEDDLETSQCSKSELQHMFNILEHQVEQSSEAFTEILQSLQDRKSEVVTKVEEIKGLESEVKKLKADFAVATQEAAAANQRIVNIWEGMKKEAALRKNKATEDVSEVQRKELKIEV